jgi:Leucine-rich repeat (LRR) protein
MLGVRNKTLKRLILKNNRIKEIPKNLNTLKKLKELDLRFNDIKILD